MQKKGELSRLAINLLIGSLIIILGVIIWIILRGGSGVEQQIFSDENIDLKISQVKKINDNTLDLTLKREIGEGEFIGLSFVVSDGSLTEVVRINTSMPENQTGDFSLNFVLLNASKIKKISVTPIYINEEGLEVIGNVKDEYVTPNTCSNYCPVGAQCGLNDCGMQCGSGCGSGYLCLNYKCIKEKTSSGGGGGSSGGGGSLTPSCTDTCSSLVKQCGIQTICGESVNCGTCSTGYVCSSGLCVLEETCTDTCNSLNYNCGTHSICGANINCGTCSTGYTCAVNGTCIKENTDLTWTNELMINGGFEFGNLTGWAVSGGSWIAGVHPENIYPQSGAMNPQAGSYAAYYSGPSNSNYYIYQDVNISSYSNSIDLGNVLINASGWGVSAEYDCDNTRIQIIFLNSAKSVISTAFDTGYNQSQYWWKRGIYNYPIPVGTRYVRVWGNSYEPNYDSGSLDSFSVKIKAGPCVDTCSSLGYNCGSVCGFSCGTCSTGYYCSSGHCIACTSHASSTCYEGDVYWYDSCGNREGIRYDCNSTQICSRGVCISSSSNLYAGTAKVDITCDVGHPMGGYTGGRICTGIHDPLYARVLVLDDGITSIAIVTVDDEIYSSNTVVNQAKALYGIDHVVLSSSHIHSGPISTGGGLLELYERGDWTEFTQSLELTVNYSRLSDDQWYAESEEKIIGAIGEAVDNLFPATLSVGQGILNSGYMSHNRRHVVNNYVTMWWDNPEKTETEPLDQTVGVIRVHNNSGNTKAMIVNYACHPVMLNDYNTEISADFPGAMADYIEENIPGAIGMFVNGGAGDIDPYYIGSGSTAFSNIEHAGQDLAEEAISVNTTFLNSGLIEAEENVMAFDDRWEASQGPHYTGVTTVVIGDTIAFVSVAGEMFIQHQIDLRNKSPLENTFLFGYSYNGIGEHYLLYIPTIEASSQEGDNYGGDYVTYLEVGAGEQIINSGVSTINQFV